MHLCDSSHVETACTTAAVAARQSTTFLTDVQKTLPIKEWNMLLISLLYFSSSTMPYCTFTIPDPRNFGTPKRQSP